MVVVVIPQCFTNKPFQMVGMASQWTESPKALADAGGLSQNLAA